MLVIDPVGRLVCERHSFIDRIYTIWNTSLHLTSRMRSAISDVLERVLMVVPKHFSVQYSINPWMGGTVDTKLALSQWNTLKAAIEKQGVKVLTMDQAESLPDMVFVCNSGLVLGNRVYLSRFRHKERVGEQSHYLHWFKQNGYTTIGEDYSGVFEGGGDAVFSDYGTLWAGYGGGRTERDSYDAVRKLGDFSTIHCEIKSPRFYHLDTCFCPVGIDSALWYPPAFTLETRKMISSRLSRAVAVSDEEANAFVCNAICVRKSVISPVGVSSQTREALRQLGYSVDEVDMSEFMKAGGACQCLVLKL